MLSLALALILSSSSPCAAPAGTAELLDLNKRIIVIGEMHGTAETPAAFAAMICEAAGRGPVTVALEFPYGLDGQLEAFLAADSEEVAIEALRDTPLLDPTFTDGRTSLAMFDMMLAVRRLRAEGRDVAFRAFQPSSERPRALFTQAYHELEMGHLLSRAAIDRPNATVLALVGNLHARKTALERQPEIGLPALAHLPAEDTLSLYVALQGGTAWNCAPTCGQNTVPSRYDQEARGVFVEPYGDGAFDGVLALGPTTASPPFVDPLI